MSVTEVSGRNNISEVCTETTVWERSQPNWVSAAAPRHNRDIRLVSNIIAQEVLTFISSSLGSRCVPWLGESFSMTSPDYPVLCRLLPYRVVPVFVQVVSPPLGWSPLSSFLVIWTPSGDTRGPSVVLEAVDMPCPGPFLFSHSVHYNIYLLLLSSP